MGKDETSSQKHKLGTRGVTPDGRIFYYAENSGTAIDHGGYLVDGIAAVAAHDMDLAATATTAGSTSFTSGTSLTVTKTNIKMAMYTLMMAPVKAKPIWLNLIRQYLVQLVFPSQ